MKWVWTIGLLCILILAGCGGYSYKISLADGEFVGDIESVTPGEFDAWVDLRFRSNGRVTGWGDIDDTKQITVTGQLQENGNLELILTENNSGDQHLLQGRVGVENVTMSGRVDRVVGENRYPTDLELVRIDPL